MTPEYDDVGTCDECGEDADLRPNPEGVVLCGPCYWENKFYPPNHEPLDL